MGDGGFWHNGLIIGRRLEPVQQGRRRADHHEERLHLGDRHADIMPSPARRKPRRRRRSATGIERTIEKTLRASASNGCATVRTYRVAKMRDDAEGGAHHAEHGLKVIIADGECQLARQRRVRRGRRGKLARGERVVRTRSASTTRSAPAIIPASACPAARR